MSKEERKLSAAEAREKADKSAKFLRCLFNSIEDAAEDGRVEIRWDVRNISRVLINQVITTLNEMGYKLCFGVNRKAKYGNSYYSDNTNLADPDDELVDLIVRW